MCRHLSRQRHAVSTATYEPHMATYGFGVFPDGLQARRAFVHPNIRAKYGGCEARRPNHSRTPTHSRTTRSLYSCHNRIWACSCEPEDMLNLKAATILNTPQAGEHSHGVIGKDPFYDGLRNCGLPRPSRTRIRRLFEDSSGILRFLFRFRPP